MHSLCRPLLPLERSLNVKPAKLRLDTTKQQLEGNAFPNKAINADCWGGCYMVRQQQIGGKAFPNKAISADAWNVLCGYTTTLGRQTLTDVLTQSLSSKPGVSITVSSKPCALRLMACGLAVSCWKDVTCATDSLNSEFAVELLPIMLLPA